MNASAEAQTLTSTLLSTIRLQRHLGARIIISTQEPTISPALLDLSSVTIVHRFTSPDWLRSLKQHLAAAAPDLLDKPTSDSTDMEEGQEEIGKTRNSKNVVAKQIFKEIVNLRVGEALLFSPSAFVGVLEKERGVRGEFRKERKMERLGTGYLKIRVRDRLTEDGGKSVMAS
jgi:hypothetical protein